MQPLGRIFGQVTGVVATPDPARPTCIVAAAASATLPDSCTVVPPDPAVPDSVATCTAGADVRCALTDANGNYDLRGFRSGGYVVRALPTDPDFIPTDPVQLQLAVSEEKQYSPRLDRKAHLTVTVLVPDEHDRRDATHGAGDIAVAIALVGRVPKMPADQATGPTGGHGGTVMFTALPAALRHGDPAAAGADRADPVGDAVDQPGRRRSGHRHGDLPAVVGRVLTVVDGVAQPLGRATVQVTGTVTVGDSNGLLPGTATVTTDANGCYAILSMEVQRRLLPTSAECTTGVSGPAPATWSSRCSASSPSRRSRGADRRTSPSPIRRCRPVPSRSRPSARSPHRRSPRRPATRCRRSPSLAQPVPLGEWVRADRLRHAWTGRHRRIGRRHSQAGRRRQCDGGARRRRVTRRSPTTCCRRRTC